MSDNSQQTDANPPFTSVSGYATIVGEALDFAWNDWCGDAGTIPDCITIHGPRTTRVSASFADSRFAELVAERIAYLIAAGQSHNDGFSGENTAYPLNGGKNGARRMDVERVAAVSHDRRFTRPSPARTQPPCPTG